MEVHDELGSLGLLADRSDTHIEAAAIGQPESQTRIVVNERIDDGRKLGDGVVTHQRVKVRFTLSQPGQQVLC